MSDIPTNKCIHGIDPRSCALCEPATTEALEQEVTELREKLAHHPLEMCALRILAGAEGREQKTYGCHCKICRAEDLLREKLAAVEHSAEHSNYWYGCRFERLREWAHASLNEEQRHAYFNIVANGTADVHEPPTYAQQMNTLKHERDAAIREIGQFAAKLEESQQAIVSVAKKRDRWEALANERARVQDRLAAERAELEERWKAELGHANKWHAEAQRLAAENARLVSALHVLWTYCMQHLGDWYMRADRRAIAEQVDAALKGSKP